MYSALETTPTQYIEGANGIIFAYRCLGQYSETTGVPLILHIHFRANMDLWDPLLINTLATRREVIIFDNTGTGRSTGTVPENFQGWADSLIALVNALKINKFDLLGFSQGGIAVQYVALTVPDMVRRLVVSGSRAAAPISHSSVKPGVAGIERDKYLAEPFRRLRISNTPESERESLSSSFFPQNGEGKAHFERYWKRLQKRQVDGESLNLRLLATDGGTKNQIKSMLTDQVHIDDPEFFKTYSGLAKLSMPVLVVNGDNDVLIPAGRSWELFSKTDNAQLLIYPKAGHGFIWQYAKEFAEDVNRFLDGGLGDKAKL